MNLFYKNSKPATILCTLGCLLGVCGAIAFIDLRSLEYLLICALGFAMVYGGMRIGEKADFKIWLEGQNQARLDKDIKKSLTSAIKIYQECPNRFTCEYISERNPEAGVYIKKDRAEKRAAKFKGKEK